MSPRERLVAFLRQMVREEGHSGLVLEAGADPLSLAVARGAQEAFPDRVLLLCLSGEAEEERVLQAVECLRVPILRMDAAALFGPIAAVLTEGVPVSPGLLDSSLRDLRRLLLGYHGRRLGFAARERETYPHVLAEAGVGERQAASLLPRDARQAILRT